MLDDVVYRLPSLTLNDLSDELVRQMTEQELEIIIYGNSRQRDASAVLDEFRLQQRWFRLHEAPNAG